MTDRTCIGESTNQFCPTLTYLGEDGQISNSCEYTVDAQNPNSGKANCGSNAWESKYELNGSALSLDGKTFTLTNGAEGKKEANVLKIAAAPVYTLKSETVNVKAQDPLGLISASAEDGQPLIVKLTFDSSIEYAGKTTKEVVIYFDSFNKTDFDARVKVIKDNLTKLPLAKIEVTKFVANDETVNATFKQFDSPDKLNEYIAKPENFIATDGSDIASSDLGKQTSKTVIMLRREAKPVAVKLANETEAKLFADAVATKGAYPDTFSTTKTGNKWRVAVGIGYKDGGADADYNGGIYGNSDSPFANSFNETRSSGRGDLPGFAADLKINYEFARFASWFALETGIMGSFSTGGADRNNKDSTNYNLSGYGTLGLEFSYPDYASLTLFAGLGVTLDTGTNIDDDDTNGESRTDGAYGYIAGGELSVNLGKGFDAFAQFYVQDDIAGKDHNKNATLTGTLGLGYSFGGDETPDINNREVERNFNELAARNDTVKVYKEPEQAFTFTSFDTVEMPNHKASAEETFEVNKDVLKTTKFENIPDDQKRAGENRTDEVNLEVYKTANVVENYIRYLESIGITAGNVNIDIGAHADSAGKYSGNKTLSEKRAAAFKKGLETELASRGIKTFTFTYTSTGFSESRPVVIACKNSDGKFEKCNETHLAGKEETIVLPEKYDVAPESPMFDKDDVKVGTYKKAADGHAQISITQKVGDDGKTVKLARNNKEYYLEALRGSRRVETIATVTNIGMFEGPSDASANVTNKDNKWFNVKLNAGISAVSGDSPITSTDKGYFFKVIEDAKKNITDPRDKMVVVVINLGTNSTITDDDLEKSMRWLGGAVTYRMAMTVNGEKRIDIPVKVVVTRSKSAETTIGIQVTARETTSNNFTEAHAQEWSELILGRKLDQGGYMDSNGLTPTTTPAPTAPDTTFDNLDVPADTAPDTGDKPADTVPTTVPATPEGTGTPPVTPEILVVMPPVVPNDLGGDEGTNDGDANVLIIPELK